MSQLVTIFGGSGFVGRYIARRMAKQGWRVRVAVRRPNEALFVKSYGAVGQVEPVFCNIRDDGSVTAALENADAAVNCVGTFDRLGRNNFKAVQEDGAARIARLSAANGVKSLVHISSLASASLSESEYAQSKRAGEEAVLRHMPQAYIFRPSVVFGPEDQFFNRFASMAQTGPILPFAGAATRFQPVYVDDIAQAVEIALTRETPAGTYELGGPEIIDFAGLMTRMLAVIERRRLLVNIPFFMARPMAAGFDFLETVTLRLFKNGILTRDQLKDLTVDNIVSETAKGFSDIDIEPTSLEAILPEYLWCYRPSGQYAAIKSSAKNLNQ
ncbi:MAG: complex I NDUFA9 subunit family protein [Rhodobacteraceae bacterium]|jgi:uncharacterized protein YbjT (DUF2867 family)|nr:complex I NDUFA9 subunit family protein [Paracoccaceae bacterium]